MSKTKIGSLKLEAISPSTTMLLGAYMFGKMSSTDVYAPKANKLCRVLNNVKLICCHTVAYHTKCCQYTFSIPNASRYLCFIKQFLVYQSVGYLDKITFLFFLVFQKHDLIYCILIQNFLIKHYITEVILSFK